MNDFIEIDNENIDVQEIMKKIRERIKKKKEAGLYPDDLDEALHAAPVFSTREDSMEAYLKGMHDNWQIDAGRSISSDRKLVAPLIVLLKKVVRRNIRWYIEDIAEQVTSFSSYTARAMSKVVDKIIVLEESQKINAERIDKIYGSSREVERLSLDTRLRRLERKADAKATKPALDKSKEAIKESVNTQEVAYVDHFRFVHKFGGSSDEKKSKQKLFTTYLKERNNVLDIGCGQGEFLELLKEQGISAIGIDIDEDMVLECKEKGLDAVQADAVSYLQSVTDDSLGGIFIGQVVEHLEPNELVDLLDLCYRKITQAGLLIVETINPLSLSVFTKSMYIDPTHKRPVHPETIKFILESIGFKDIKFHYMSPSPEEHKLKPLDMAPGLPEEEKRTHQVINDNIDKLNNILFGFEDYAVIAKK